MQINPTDFEYPGAHAYVLVNQLLVDAEEFARIACLDGRLHGVKTFCDTCNVEISPCVRSHTVSGLVAAQALVEKTLGYYLTPRYHVEEIDWNGKDRLLLTEKPGIEAVNVKQEVVPVTGNFAVASYIDADLSNSGEGFCVAMLDSDLFDNPNKVTFRNAATFNPVETRQIAGYPRRNSDGDWEVALEPNYNVPACDTPLIVQHCSLIHVDADVNCGETDGTIYPVYPGTLQYIPQAKPAQDLGEGVTRYWFYVWSLVDPDFADESIDLVRAEFYKLLPYINFVCVREVTAYPEIICARDCDCESETIFTAENETPAVKVEISDAYHGILSLCTVKNPCGCNKGAKKLRLYYKTSPHILGVMGALQSLKEAITYYVAASLPLTYCNCKIETGFIAEAQKAYTEVRVNPITGQMAETLKYGNLHGFLVFGERMLSAPRYQRLIRL